VARKRAQPGDDVISRLCATEETGDDEIAMLSMFLLFAGHETTVTAIGTGALLLTEPDQRQALGREPALVTAGVEEILRAGGQGGGAIPRYARAGLRIADITIRPGDLVLLDNGAANHDRTAFIDPERFDISRPAVPHLSFGHGARYCIGAPLARIELQSVFSQLVPRFLGMRLAEPAAQLTFSRDTLAGGLARLPVTW
jgi:pentalenolactone synthase